MAAEHDDAQAKLRRSERHFKLLMEKCSDYVAIVTQDGTITYNKTSDPDTLGYLPEDTVGTSAFDFLFPEDRPQAVKVFTEVLREAGATGRLQVPVQAADGSRRIFEFVGVNLLEEPAVEGVVLSYRDITESKRREDELRAGEQLLMFALEIGQMGVWDMDVANHTAERSLLHDQIFGYPTLLPQWTFEMFLEHVIAEDRPAVQAHIQNAIDNALDCNFECRIRRVDGQVHWIWAAGRHSVRSSDGARRMVGIVQDIDHRIRMEEALRHSEQRFQIAKEAAELGIYDYDVASDTIRWDSRIRDLFGITPDEPISHDTFVERVHAEDRPAIEAVLDKAFDPSSGGKFSYEHRITRRSDGAERWICVTGQTFFDQGHAVRLVGTIQDITDLKRAQESLRELNRSLEQRVAERTAEVEEQARMLRALANQLSRTEQIERKRVAIILHDHIQQLLVAAGMQLDWIKRAKDASRVHAIAQGVQSMVHEAVDASRSLAIELSPPVLHEAGLVGGLNWLASYTLEKHQVAVHLLMDKKAEPAIEATRFLLFECARELLFNAVKHAGVTEVKVTLARTSDKHIKLVVSDKGRGFDPQLLRGRTQDETTFGLFSVQERMAYIGGHMEIETAPGGGTKITLTAPVGEAQAPQAAAEVMKEEPKEPITVLPKSEACRIMIVDDHKIMRQGLAGLLQFEPGLEVVGEAQDGPEAIRLARELNPDVIVMDVNLGQMSGIEATRQILEDNPAVKVIGLSMHMASDVAMSMREAGAVAYMTKGGPADDLVSSIKASCSSKAGEGT
ncbi:MAG: PAS domain S-box protein [Planctomycetaceae bacterium]|nr:PAS domain S-box protein [Planctomycetaceae bacterium]